MKSWFPFTDYDFYGYLACGFAVLFAADHVLLSQTIMLREQWPFVQIVLVVALAYCTGHIVAAPSSIFLEHFVARRLLTPPMTILAGLKALNRFERFFGRCVIGRYYEPISATIREKALARIATATGKPIDEIKPDGELVFQFAFEASKSVPETAKRLEEFRNLYGLCRNMSFAGIVVALLFLGEGILTPDPIDWKWVAASLIFAVGLFIRFEKFYCAFAAEALRTFALKN